MGKSAGLTLRLASVTGGTATLVDEREQTVTTEETVARRRWASALIVAGIVLLSWHRLPLQPHKGLDTSWEAALHMALHFHLDFGKEIVFTYGPLGFLSVPTLWYAGTGVIAVLYTLLLRVALAGLLYLVCRRTFGAVLGAVVALLVADASGTTLEAVPFFVVAVVMVDRPPQPRRLLALLALLGAVVGIELLNKQSTGLELLVLAALTALATRSRSPASLGVRLAVTLAAALVALLVGWGAAGQSYGALGSYISNSAHVISGYAAGMGWENHANVHNGSFLIEAIAAFVAFAAGLVAALHMTAGESSRQRRWGIVALWVVFCLFQFKASFVRHDVIHDGWYFVALLGAFVALRWRPESRGLAACFTALLLLFAVLGQKGHPVSLFNPVANAKAMVSQLAKVAIGSKRNATIAAGRQSIQSDYPIDPATLGLLRGHTVDVLPYQTSVAWAYRFDWRPLPVFQSYAVYSTPLDQLNANALASTRAPERILRNRDKEIDDRLEVFDEGITSRAILCGYRELRTTPKWQVLAKGPDRCGGVVALGSVHANWHQPVPVPAPPNGHSFVFVRVHGAGLNSLERFFSLIYKPAQRVVILQGAHHRFVEGTAEDGLILRAPRAVDFSHPFRLAPQTSTIAVGKSGRGEGAGNLTFSFYAQSVNEGPRGPLPAAAQSRRPAAKPPRPRPTRARGG